jgi:hypothetical protein
MLIQSRFKDYYDFVAAQYGGGDPKVRYLRGGLRRTEIFVDRFPLADPLSWPHLDADYELAYLIVAGKAYLLRRDKKPGRKFSDFRVADAEAVSEADRKTRTAGRRYLAQRRVFGGRDFDFTFGRQYDFLVSLHRAAGAPALVIDQVWRPASRDRMQDRIQIDLWERCPVLKHLGMAAVVSPEQMYQELAYFVGNLMKVSPDIAPPVEVDNQHKILAAGFDLKTSFRHRK